MHVLVHCTFALSCYETENQSNDIIKRSKRAQMHASMALIATQGAEIECGVFAVLIMAMHKSIATMHFENYKQIKQISISRAL